MRCLAEKCLASSVRFGAGTCVAGGGLCGWCVAAVAGGACVADVAAGGLCGGCGCGWRSLKDQAYTHRLNGLPA